MIVSPHEFPRQRILFPMKTPTSLKAYLRDCCAVCALGLCGGDYAGAGGDAAAAYRGKSDCGCDMGGRFG